MMSEEISKTLLHGNFDSVFKEIAQSEVVNWTTQGELHLFHLSMSDSAIDTDELKRYVYLCIGDYVFSRALIDRFAKDGQKEAIIAQAQRILQKNGGADLKGHGGELGEVLNYIFMEEKLKAPKLMSRVEINAVGNQYQCLSDNIHLLLGKTAGVPYHQIIFGSSSVVGDLEYAINEVFERIHSIKNNKSEEMRLVNKLAFERMATTEEAALVKEILLPSPSKKTGVNTSYGIFLGYSLGLDKNHPCAEYENLAEKKMQADIKHYIPTILQKIKDYDLGGHSFYIYVVPFNDAESEKRSIMEAVIKGDIDLL